MYKPELQHFDQTSFHDVTFNKFFFRYEGKYYTYKHLPFGAKIMAGILAPVWKGELGGRHPWEDYTYQ